MILNANFRTFIFYKTTRCLLLNKINQFYSMALLTVISPVSFWLRQITVTEVIIVTVIMGLVVTVFMMISFFFQSYTITVITLEMSYSFSGQIILTVTGNISLFNHLILSMLFSRTQPQFLGWKFGGSAVVALFHILQMLFVRLILSLMTREHSGDEQLSIFL